MKIILLLSLILLINTNLISQKLIPVEAEKVAEKVIIQKILPLSDFIYKIDSYKTEIYNDTEVFYIFNLKPQGFIIISATKAAEPLLAFSYESDFDKNYNLAASQWLDSYAKQIEYIIQKDIKPSIETEKEWDYWLNNVKNISKEKITPVEPLLNTKWDQGVYYNAHCPKDNGGLGGRAVTGCVATTLAQLMNYFRYPSSGEGSYGYQHPDYGWLEVDFSQKDYNYDEMPLVLLDENDAVAELIYDIGVSVDMQYGPQSSGMTNHKGAYTLKTYFKYAPETKYLFKDSLPDDFDWKGTLINHLKRKIPLYYAGWGDYEYVSGHAFILDGYTDSSHYHINWGWGGYMDGYFFIDELTPGGNDFTLVHEVIINAVPILEPDYCNGLKILNSVNGTIEDGSGSINSYGNNIECSWLIAPQDTINGIKIEFIKFNIHDSDYIIIYDGDSENAEVLETFYGGDEIFELTSTSNKVLIKFITDSDFVDDGWLLSYSSIKPQLCGGATLTTDSGTISDGSNNYLYLNSSNCTWSINPEDAYNIRLRFLEFDLQEDKDLLKIYSSLGFLVHTLTGPEIPEPLIIESSSLTLKFTSDRTVRGNGFKLVYDINVNTDPTYTNIIKTEGLSVYPNPANDKLFLDYHDLSGQVIINVINYNGNILLKEQKYINPNSVTELNISDLLPGLYFVSIINGQNIYNCKFTKE